MNDAFDALRADTAPIATSPAFAARLRDQLITALGTPMTTTDTPAATHARQVTLYLSVRNAAAAIDFYVAALGATELHRLVESDGRIGHAELQFGDTVVALADEYPEFDVRGPESLGGSSCSIRLEVDDVDTTHALALAHGATELRPVEDQFHGSRNGVVRDPFGHRWMLSTPIAGFDQASYRANAAEMGLELHEAVIAEAAHDHQLKHYGAGDLYYFTLPTADLAKAQAFYGAVLGWQFPDADNGHVGNISAPPGSAFGAETGVTDLYFVVDDIHAAVAVVRSHGGTADEPVHYDSGWAATCTDDQGVRFHLSVPADKYRT